jgi:hypothetical protein
MKQISLAIASIGLIIGLNADTTSDLITAKEVWGGEYGDATPTIGDEDDNDDDENQNDQKNEPWPNRKPNATEGSQPSLLNPKPNAGKEAWYPDQGD